MANNVVQVGDIAPDFTLPSTAGKDITLSDFRGTTNVLLAFFPMAFTGTCTSELCGFSDDRRRFDEASVKILGISVDSVPVLKEYRSKYNMTVDLLSDFKGVVSRKYGTLIEETFFSDRAYFIIDVRGVVRWKHFEADLGDKRDNVELLAELRKLQQSEQ